MAAEIEVAAARLAAVRRGARRRACLYAKPVLERAADLLSEVIAVGERYGVPAARWDVDLAGAALDAISEVVDERKATLTTAEAEALLDGLVVALATQDPPIRARRDGWTVELVTPPAERTGYQHPLAVSCTAESGWTMTFNREFSGQLIPVVLMSAGFSPDEAQDVADLVARVNRGDAGDPFDGRR